MNIYKVVFDESVDRPVKQEKVNGYSYASTFFAISYNSVGPQMIFVELQPEARKVYKEG